MSAFSSSSSPSTGFSLVSKNDNNGIHSYSNILENDMFRTVSTTNDILPGLDGLASSSSNAVVTNGTGLSPRTPTFLGSIDSSFSNSQNTVVSTSAYSVDSSISSGSSRSIIQFTGLPNSNSDSLSGCSVPLSISSNHGDTLSPKNNIPGSNSLSIYEQNNNNPSFMTPTVNNNNNNHHHSHQPIQQTYFTPPLPNHNNMATFINGNNNNNSYNNSNNTSYSSFTPPLPSNPPHPSAANYNTSNFLSGNQPMYTNNTNSSNNFSNGIMDSLSKSMNQLDLTVNNNSNHYRYDNVNLLNKQAHHPSSLVTENLMNPLSNSFPYPSTTSMVPNSNQTYSNNNSSGNNQNNNVSLPSNYFSNHAQSMTKQPITNPITLHHQNNNYYGNGSFNQSGVGQGNTVPVPGPDPLAYLRLNLRVDCAAIAEGKEQRTTIMIRNIPSRYTQQLLIDELVASGFRGSFDFIYLPIDFRNGCSMGYSFANFIHPQDVVHFFTRWNGRRWPQFSSRKRCELAFARIQGKQALVEHFQHSRTLLASPANCRPIVFISSGPRRGEIEPFPFRYTSSDSSAVSGNNNSTVKFNDPLLDFSNDYTYKSTKDTGSSTSIGNFSFNDSGNQRSNNGSTIENGFGKNNQVSVMPNLNHGSTISQTWNNQSLNNEFQSSSFNPTGYVSTNPNPSTHIPVGTNDWNTTTGP